MKIKAAAHQDLSLINSELFSFLKITKKEVFKIEKIVRKIISETTRP